MQKTFPRILIGGSGSGCGKTTVTCALLYAFKKKYDVRAFKCGPDYIDPMFHEEVLKIKSRNLDPFLCGEERMKYLFCKNGGDADISIVEGVMGIYDGYGMSDDKGSSNSIAMMTDTPELLVLNVKGKGYSLGAEALGYLNYEKNNIKGFILNNCNPMMYSRYTELLKEKTGLKCYGYLPVTEEARIESRHLGLITAAEIGDLKEKMTALGEKAEESLDLDGIMELAKAAPAITYEESQVEAGEPVKIAVAKDRSMCFYYEDALDLLRDMGAELIYFSPMKDGLLPEGVKGIILGGGYPELYLNELSGNKSMLRSIYHAIENGMPVYAECGGFMYLGRSIVSESREYEMVGILPGRFELTNKLVRFGYKTMVAKKDNMLCKAGEELFAHEFHYSDGTDVGCDFIARGRTGKEWEAGFAGENIYAAYPHLNLAGVPKAAAGFLDACRAYGKKGEDYR